MSKDIKSLLAQKLAENNARHANASQSIHLDVGPELKRLALDKIKPNPYQPRTVFDQADLANLTDSIKEVGLLQPISVREKETGDYELIAGERRLKAYERLGKTHIDAIVSQANDSEMAILALAENASRQDLCDYEIGKALKNISHLFPNKTRLAEAVGLNREDMYRYFSYDALPIDFLAKLSEHPHLLARSAATQIKQVLAELHWPEEKINTEMLKVWELLSDGKIEQTKIANYLRQVDANHQTTKVNHLENQVIMQQGKIIGKLHQKGKKLILEVKASVISKEQAEKLSLFIHQLVNE